MRFGGVLVCGVGCVGGDLCGGSIRKKGVWVLVGVFSCIEWMGWVYLERL